MSAAWLARMMCGHLDVCFATGNVAGTGDVIGGLIGLSEAVNEESRVRDCYATGAVTGFDYVGGFIGEILPRVLPA